MNEKRVTDLVNLRIMKQTERVFPEEITVLRGVTNFTRRVTRISKTAVNRFNERPHLQAIMDLFCRNRDLVHFSLVCLLNGGYAETKILSRAGLENFMLIRLFNLKPAIAKDWFSNPDEFRKRWSPEAIRKTVFAAMPSRSDSFAKFYGILCSYTHPSFNGWIELMSKKQDGVYIGCRPEFNSDYASECIGFVSWVAIQSIKGYSDAFAEWLTDELILETNKLMPKLHEIVTRHFEVRIYDKKKMIS
jgi:hypothetical protein